MQGWVRPKQGAYYSDVGERTFWTWMSNGLRHAKIGGVTLIKISWIDDFLESREVIKDGNKVNEIVDEVCNEIF